MLSHAPSLLPLCSPVLPSAPPHLRSLALATSPRQLYTMSTRSPHVGREEPIMAPPATYHVIFCSFPFNLYVHFLRIIISSLSSSLRISPLFLYSCYRAHWPLIFSSFCKSHLLFLFNDEKEEIRCAVF